MGLTSVVVVSFQSAGLLSRCARAVLASSASVEIIVVDNGSSDGSLAGLQETAGGDPRLRVLENHANLGFARACNLGLSQARGEWLLFLNPDCLVQPDTIARMQEVLRQRPEAGMAGCLILNPDGTEQAGCRRERPTVGKAIVRAFGMGRLGRRFGLDQGLARDFVRKGDPLPDHPVEVDAISGAFMFVRRSALGKVGPLDEGYFLHCEDLDWCERFRRAGYSILFVPQVAVVHEKGASSRGRPVRVLWHMHSGMVRYYRKFLRDGYPLPLFGLVIAGIWMRFGVLAVRALVWRGVGVALRRA